MFKRKKSKKRSRAMLSAYSIIMILIILLGVLSHVLPKAKYMAVVEEEETVQVESSMENLLTTEPILGEDGSLESDLVAVEEETKTYDTKDACEEENDECVIVDGSGVQGAELYQILMAPILGFGDAIDVCIFVMVLGGFLAVVART